MNSQRADLAQVLKENHFNPDDFEIVDSTAQAATREKGDKLRLKGTDYFFSIYPNESEYEHEQFFVEYSPGQQKLRELDLCGNFTLVAYKFAEYLSFLRRELEASDRGTNGA